MIIALVQLHPAFINQHLRVGKPINLSFALIFHTTSFPIPSPKMPSAKKQKTARGSKASSSSTASAPAPPPNKNSSATNEQDGASSEEGEDPAPYDYICIPRHFFDFQGENWLARQNKSSDYVSNKTFNKRYKSYLEEVVKMNLFKASPSDHPGHKWVIMWNAYLKMDLLGRKAEYCNPDNFNMNMYTDWRGWGMQEILEREVRVLLT